MKIAISDMSYADLLNVALLVKHSHVEALNLITENVEMLNQR